MNLVIGGSYKGALISSTFSQKREKRLKMTYKGRVAPLIPSVSEFVDKGRVKKGHLMEIQYVSGKTSLAEVDDNIYSIMLASMYSESEEPEKAPKRSRIAIGPYIALFFVLAPLVFFIYVMSGAWGSSSQTTQKNDASATSASMNSDKPEWQVELDVMMASFDKSRQVEFVQYMYGGGDEFRDDYEYLSSEYNITCTTLTEGFAEPQIYCVRQQ